MTFEYPSWHLFSAQFDLEMKPFKPMKLIIVNYFAQIFSYQNYFLFISYVYYFSDDNYISESELSFNTLVHLKQSLTAEQKFHKDAFTLVERFPRQMKNDAP